MPKRQLTLFPAQPASQSDISKHTPLAATFVLFQEYLRHEGKSEHTIKAFIGDMRLLAEYSGDDTEIRHYNTTNLNQYLHWMEHERGVPCSQKTYARRVTALKVYFKWLRELSAIPHNPALAVIQRSGQAPLSNALSPAQVRSAIAFAQSMKRSKETDHRPELLFRLLLETGIKKSEAAQLSLDDIDQEDVSNPVILIRHKARNVYKERRIAIDREWIKLLDLYVQQYEPGDMVFNCTSRNLEYILTDIGEGAGIPFKLSFEVMRWSSAVRDYRAGTDEETIREKLGLSPVSWYETGAKVRRLAEQQIADEDA